ncbi:hypothetical protein H6P81_018369 [Aristolochia fimbriata]|uniref:J domain-containing protein n=1 Tax=Aristolochia fimbriata TaxID=158543 RepID=A0AAV7E0V7_ARIFI|nr:hypothetical protein H6P81_018369 [Aristolochia fimbriata]
MSAAVKTSLKNSQFVAVPVRVASFHSTPVSERRRRTNWDSGFAKYARTSRRMDAKRTLLRNVSAYAELLFQSWKAGEDEREGPSCRGPSWFTKGYSARGKKWNSNGPEESQWDSYRSKGKGHTRFCDSDDEDVETVFQSAFRGERVYYWSFSSGGNFHWKSSWTDYSRFRFEDEYDHSSTGYHRSSVSDSSSERLALGLSATGPVQLEEIKSAYRACALKWHPDRHQGAAKAAAEEKFKHCSAAYKTLCDKFAMAR